MAPALLDDQSQPPQTFFTETPMLSTQAPYNAPQGMPQDPYLHFQNSLDSWALPPQTAIAPFGNSVRIAPSIPSQPHRIKGFSLHRPPQPNGTVSVGWVHRSSVSGSRIWSSLSLPRCVFLGCNLDVLLISWTPQPLPSLPLGQDFASN